MNSRRLSFRNQSRVKMVAKKQSTSQTKKNVSETELLRQHERFLVIWRGIFTTVKTACLGGTLVAFAYVTFYLPIVVSHGETTAVTMTIKFFSEIKASVLLAWGSTAAATTWAVWERRLRQSERSKASERNRILEVKIDPRVTSSGLNSAGTKAITDG